MIGVEAGGRGSGYGEHAARFLSGRPGVLHGTHSWVLQDDHGQISPTHSVSAGLDYASVGPEHALLRVLKRAEYTTASVPNAWMRFVSLPKQKESARRSRVPMRSHMQ